MLAVWVDSYSQSFGEDYCYLVDCEIAEAAGFSVVLVGCLAHGLPAFVEGKTVPVGSHDSAAFFGFAFLGQWVACLGLLVVFVEGFPHGDRSGFFFEAVGVYEFPCAVGVAGGVEPESLVLLEFLFIWAVYRIEMFYGVRECDAHYVFGLYVWGLGVPHHLFDVPGYVGVDYRYFEAARVFPSACSAGTQVRGKKKNSLYYNYNLNVLSIDLND